jgi:hypothetical protein
MPGPDGGPMTRDDVGSWMAGGGGGGGGGGGVGEWVRRVVESRRRPAATPTVLRLLRSQHSRDAGRFLLQ